MSAYKALTTIIHDGKRYAVGDLLQLSDTDAKRIASAVELVGEAKAVAPKPAIPAPALTPPNNPDKKPKEAKK